MLSAEIIEIEGFDGEGNVCLAVETVMKDLYGKVFGIKGGGKAEVAENSKEGLTNVSL
jgi:hypothetical protein